MTFTVNGTLMLLIKDLDPVYSEDNLIHFIILTN